MTLMTSSNSKLCAFHFFINPINAHTLAYRSIKHTHMIRINSIPEYKPAYREHRRIFANTLWIQLRKRVGKSRAHTLSDTKCRARMAIKQVMSFTGVSGADFQSTFTKVNEVMDMFYEDYESLPVFIKQEIVQSNMNDVWLRAELLQAWLNIYETGAYLDRFKYEHCGRVMNGFVFEIWRMGKSLYTSKSFAFQKELMRKSVETCEIMGESWAQLSLPDPLVVIKQHALRILETLSHYALESVIDETLFVEWGKYFKYYVQLFGYHEVPGEYYETKIDASVNRFFSARVFPEKSISTKRSLFRRIIESFRNVPVINRRIYQQLGLFLTSNLPCLALDDNQETFIQTLVETGNFIWHSRQSLGKVSESSIRYKFDKNILTFTYKFFMTSDYVQVRYALFQGSDLMIFCKRSIAHEHQLILDILSGTLSDDSPHIREYVIFFQNKPEYEPWTGPVEHIITPRMTPPLPDTLFDVSFYHIRFHDQPAANDFLMAIADRKYDDILEYPARPADARVADCLLRLDMEIFKLTEQIISLADMIGGNSDLPSKTRHDYFTTASLFVSGFMKASRVTVPDQFRQRAFDFCALWLDFLKSDRQGSILWRRQFASFIQSGESNARKSIGLECKHQLVESFARFDEAARIEFAVNVDSVWESFEGRSLGDPLNRIGKWEQPPRVFLRPNLQKLLLPSSPPAVTESAVQTIPRVISNWQRLCMIGSGSSGKVFEVMNGGSGKIMALKEVKNEPLKEGLDVFAKMRAEFDLVSRLCHPNIIKYYSVHLNAKNNVQLFMEHSGAAPLSRHSQNGPISDIYMLRMYSRQILEGLRYLHSKRICHLDIKPDNIMMNWQGVLKIVDFGSAVRVDSGDLNLNWQDLQGTPAYMAPELATMSADVTLLCKADIWSFGCTLYQLASGERPWPQMDNDWGILIGLGRADITKFMTKRDLIDPWTLSFIDKCLVWSQRERPSASDLLNDSYTLQGFFAD